jgi:hypothetical protein
MFVANGNWESTIIGANHLNGFPLIAGYSQILAFTSVGRLVFGTIRSLTCKGRLQKCDKKIAWSTSKKTFHSTPLQTSFFCFQVSSFSRRIFIKNILSERVYLALAKSSHKGIFVGKNIMAFDHLYLKQKMCGMKTVKDDNDLIWV